MIASGLSQPNGVAMRNGALYVATTNRILRFDDIERRLDSPPTPVVVRDSLPNPDQGHTWKFIAFGPDDMLYISVGAPCNVCLSPPMVSTILRMKPDGSSLETFAEGVRNTVGFDWHPATRELWFTDNGRDALGDDVPGDELNVAWKAGHALRLPVLPSGRPDGPAVRRAAGLLDDRAARAEARRARRGARLHVLHRHDVPRQLQERGDPRGAWLMEPLEAEWLSRHGAAHGWSPRDELRTFLDGFLPGPRDSMPGGWGAQGAALGRPVDVLQMPDGSVLISDDKAVASSASATVGSRRTHMRRLTPIGRGSS